MMAMKQIRFLFAGVVVMMLATGPSVLAYSQDNGKSSSGSSSSKPTHKGMARTPYLGAMVVEAVSGRVLFEDQADTRGSPASMQKLMGLVVILEKLEHGQLSLQDQVLVSAKAAQTGGSQVWLAEKELFSVDEMLYALMVQSANDAAVALAEKVAGTTDAFVQLMNRRAKELGMNSTFFYSLHRLPPRRGQEHDLTPAPQFPLPSLPLPTPTTTL